MKKFWLYLLTLAALMPVLAGCGSEPAPTAAEAYLAGHTEEEIFARFEEAPYFFQDFDDPTEITNHNLYSFAMLHEKDEWHNKEEHLFYIPLADLYAIWDEYLPEYNFDTDWLKDNFDAETQTIIVGVTGMGSGGAWYRLISRAEAIDADNVAVTLLGSFEDYDYDEPLYWEEYITAKIIDGNAKFTSLHRQSRDAAPEVSADQAIEALRENLLTAYENTYGEYQPSDTPPDIYTADKDRLAYIIPRLSVSEENEYFYVIPVIWDFWVNKCSGQIYVHYQGLEDSLTPFDPASDTALSFAG